MKLYRFTGRCELFQDCGMNWIPPIVSGNLTQLKKEAIKYRASARKAGLSHYVWIEVLEVRKLDQAVLIEALEAEDTHALVIKIGTKGTWEWTREDS